MSRIGMIYRSMRRGRITSTFADTYREDPGIVVYLGLPNKVMVLGPGKGWYVYESLLSNKSWTIPSNWGVL